MSHKQMLPNALIGQLECTMCVRPGGCAILREAARSDQTTVVKSNVWNKEFRNSVKTEKNLEEHIRTKRLKMLLRSGAAKA
mmetsp:Transcript_37608/g.56072  ORF Transcript_37608/g.56072 Transcript_37608/m.56072 type:complete len:81 (+) Transcript_37608:57-299(+)